MYAVTFEFPPDELPDLHTLWACLRFESANLPAYPTKEQADSAHVHYVAHLDRLQAKGHHTDRIEVVTEKLPK